MLIILHAYVEQSGKFFLRRMSFQQYFSLLGP